MSKMLGVETLVRKLEGLATKSRKDASLSVKVVYLAPYSTFVHEDMQAVHQNGRAKFLSTPARENRQKYADIVTRKIKNHRSWAEALTVAGQTLLKDSQELVPVLTGTLKASGVVMLVPGR